MKHSAFNCDCESCRRVRQLWADAAAAEDPERLLLTDGNGALAFSDTIKAVIWARGRAVSPYFNERLAMHGGAISAEEEAKQLMGTLDPASSDPDIEIREIRTGTEEIKRFEVTVKRPELDWEAPHEAEEE